MCSGIDELRLVVLSSVGRRGTGPFGMGGGTDCHSPLSGGVIR